MLLMSDKQLLSSLDGVVTTTAPMLHDLVLRVAIVHVTGAPLLLWDPQAAVMYAEQHVLYNNV
jgi:hypothetical protein